MRPSVIYIAGSRQHSGKTIASLGIISLLSKVMPVNQLGYIKPVGQEVVNIETGQTLDKDVVIVDTFSGIPILNAGTVSPVQLPSGFTKNFLSSDNQAEVTESLKKRILKAAMTFKDKKIVIAEGTGHPGVGGIVGLSNAEVCNLIDSDILYVTEGGIGSALDKMEVDLSYFKLHGNRVRGIIFNKVIPGKIDQTKHYLTEELINRKFNKDNSAPIRILGYLPNVTGIFNPSMNALRVRFKNHVPIGNTSKKLWRKPLNRIKVISLVAETMHLEKYIEPGDLVLIAASSRNRSSRIIRYAKEMSGYLGGLILTNSNLSPVPPYIENQIKESNIPAIMVDEDIAKAEQIVYKSYGSTKIQTYDNEKMELIRDLFERHFDLGKFLDTFTPQLSL